ncbi:MAG: efflux RND transporter periplasmic adaptor subunit [Planctomycetota bacterium]|jgi:HlyD family secretion protein
MKRYIKPAAVVRVLIGIASAIIYSKMAAPKPPVSCSIVKRGTVEESVDETGQAILDRTLMLSMATGGFLELVTLEAGDTVQKGQVLARIDGADIQTKMDAASAQVEVFEAQAKGAETQKPKPASFEGASLAVEGARKRLAMTKREVAVLKEQKNLIDLNLDRAKALAAEGLAQQSRIDELTSHARSLAEQVASAKEAVSAGETEVKAAEAAEKLLEQAKDDPDFLKLAFLAQAKASRATLRSLQIEEKRLEVKAPFTGIILERHNRGGAIVPPGTPVFLLGDTESLEVEVEVLSDDISLVNPGQRAVLYGGALGDSEVEGKVRKIFPKAFPKISSLGIEQKRVKVRVETPENRWLHHGYRVEVRIITRSRENAIRVQAGSVFRRNGKDNVFVHRDGSLSLVPLEVGLSNENWYEVSKGLQGGEEVVTDRPSRGSGLVGEKTAHPRHERVFQRAARPLQ